MCSLAKIKVSERGTENNMAVKMADPLQLNGPQN